jgi:hypothetical protein
VTWLIRHIDRALLSIARILSVAWIAEHIRHPLTEERPSMAIVNDHYIPPSAASPRPP